MGRVSALSPELSVCLGVLNEVLGPTRSLGAFNMKSLMDPEEHLPGLCVISDEIVGISDAKEMLFVDMLGEAAAMVAKNQGMADEVAAGAVWYAHMDIDADLADASEC